MMMSKINKSNFKKTIYYLKRNGLQDTFLAALERLQQNRQQIYEYQDISTKVWEEQHNWSKENKSIFFSILVPAYRTRETHLRAMIESVLDQSYENFELLIADAGNEERNKVIVKSYSDDRIQYIPLQKNAGISDNTNEALRYAKGDYIGLLDHDDLLTKDALFEMAVRIKQYESAGKELQLLYSDEDKCDDAGERFYEPHRKQDFNLDLILSNNYICHFMMVKAELMKKLGLRKEFDGAQDYDLVLRCIREISLSLQDKENGTTAISENQGVSQNREVSQDRGISQDRGVSLDRGISQDRGISEKGVSQDKGISENRGVYLDRGISCILKYHEDVPICHIPKVLYHWRCHQQSTAENPQSKQYAYEAGGRAIRAFLSDMQIAGDVTETKHLGFYRIHYKPDMLSQRMDVGAIGGKILGKGNKITGGIYSAEGSCPYQGIYKGYSGYMHLAMLTQEAYAIDIRLMQIRPELFDTVNEIVEKYTTAGEEQLQIQDRVLDVSQLSLSETQYRMLSIQVCKKIHELGYRVVWTPDWTKRL